MRLTSELLSNAISFARSEPGIARSLQERDQDDALYLAGILCRMQRYTQDPDHFYLRIIFDYSFFQDEGRKGPDVFIDLTTYADGTFKVLPPPAAIPQDHLMDTRLK